jgi:hypothetical protein
MGKSKPKSYGRRNWFDDEEDYNNDHRKENNSRRKEKRMRNLIRSKNVDQLMNLDDDDNQYDWGPDRV